MRLCHTSHNQQGSALIDLPPELRNRIYELVYGDTWAARNAINVGDASARKPSSALLRCCQRTREEGQGVFEAAFQRFWEREFTFDQRYNSANRLFGMPLTRVRHFKIIFCTRYRPHRGSTAVVDPYRDEFSTHWHHGTTSIVGQNAANWIDRFVQHLNTTPHDRDAVRGLVNYLQCISIQPDAW